MEFVREPSGMEPLTVREEWRDRSREAGQRHEDTLRLAVKAEPVRAPSAITITAVSPAAIRRAEAPAWARRMAALAEEDTLAAEATVVAGVANQSFLPSPDDSGMSR